MHTHVYIIYYCNINSDNILINTGDTDVHIHTGATIMRRYSHKHTYIHTYSVIMYCYIVQRYIHHQWILRM